jgi:H+-transporting ATPase
VTPAAAAGEDLASTAPDNDLPDTDLQRGLTAAEAAARLTRFGPNAIAEQSVPAWLQLARKFWAPVPWMLEVVILLQLALGRALEAVVIAALLVFNGVVAQLQERRAKNALALLRQRLHVNARVLREGQWQLMPAEQIVLGDVVHVRAGDLVPADLKLTEGNVDLDQSALTGESLPVEATRGNAAYTGAIVRRGEATGLVTATGAHTYFGRTAELVRASNPPSHMQTIIFSIVKRLVLFDAVLVLVVLGYAALHHLPPLDTAIFALMLLVASVPVALPATYTLATALASQQLAQRGVLITRLAAVEEAAAMDTLVSDKTGTLTQNALTYSGSQSLAPDVDENALLRAAALASDDATQDSLDLAFLQSARERGLLAGIPPRQSFSPFDPATRRSAGLYTVDSQPWQALKGAANVIGPLCKLDSAQQQALSAAEQALAASGARVLAVAAGHPDAPRLLGVVGLADPPRPDAAALISQLKQLGVRVRMATGDALETARAIGRQLGLGTRTCTPDAATLENPADCDLFARVLPADKHAIVKGLQNKQHVTGMTGDGVNDAPALRQAELGIAVASATDVAKAAAGVVLTDPGLSGVLAVVHIGREVHRRMLTYTLNKVLRTLVIVVFLTGGLLLTGRFLIDPMLIVLMLFANDFATMAIADDHVRPAARPQRWRVRQLMGAAAVFGAVSLVGSIVIYLICVRQGLDAPQLQTVVFLILVLTNQTGIYVFRHDESLWRLRPSRALAAASLGDTVAIVVLALLGWLMAPLPPTAIGVVLAGAVILALLLDAIKRPLFTRFSIA